MLKDFFQFLRNAELNDAFFTGKADFFAVKFFEKEF